MGIEDADSEEHHSLSKNLVVTACYLPQRKPGMTWVERTEKIRMKPGTLAARVFGEAAHEELICNYELNRDYQERLDASGMRITGFDERGVGRVAEIEGHPFYLVSLFLPQINPQQPHRYFLEFLQAAKERHSSHSVPRAL